MENDWQGVPPTRRSIVPGSMPILRSHRLRMQVKSLRFGMCGKRWASTDDGARSISANATASQPSGCQASEAASIPEQTLKYRTPPSR